MESITLGHALELEHRVIDGGIETFIASLEAAATANSAPLNSALHGLRRHIYLEEEFLFPPLKGAGLMGPLFVMMREHGQLWRQMHAVEALLDVADLVEVQASPDAEAEPGRHALAASATKEDALREACTELLALLDAHNAKEETIIYAHADAILGTVASNDLLAFLGSGSMPESWVCSAA